MAGTLFLVATPIGNLKDITLRAIETLKSADPILCEDTRKSGKLFEEYKIRREAGDEKLPKLLSYHDHNAEERIPQVIALLKEGKNVALISNAGTPTVSDPGFKLVRECAKEGISVKAVPGASAVLSALAVSGLPTDKFLFLGYLPRKSGKRRKLLSSLKELVDTSPFDHLTLIAFESPYRLVGALEDIQKTLGEIDISVCRELTKLYEEVRREKVNSALSHFRKTKPKGEITLVFTL
jgi:16S rRNA (cytidine1402-2'-O)-methyltransferase